MSSKTKILVLHMKEIIYTAIFIVLGILLIILLTFMFFPKQNKSTNAQVQYTPGVYTSSVTLNHMELEVEVSVDASHINAIRFCNLEDSIATMYPMMQPTMEYLAEQICESQSLEGISYYNDSPYTSKVLLNAIEKALNKAAE